MTEYWWRLRSATEASAADYGGRRIQRWGGDGGREEEEEEEEMRLEEGEQR